MEQQLFALYNTMIEFFAGDPRRCQHWIKVHSISRQLGIAEGLDEHTLFVLEATAMLHDCGIKPGEIKYGIDHAHGHVQEVEGPPEAEKMLKSLSFIQDDIDRVCYLIAHHHTYDDIQGMDYQILVEADFMVNLFEKNADKETVSKALNNIFRTNAGIKLCRTMFGLE